MIVRFGYVAMSVQVQNASPSKTMTVTQFAKLTDRQAAVRKLERIAAENLANTLRLLRHNRAHEIRLYRFSSRLIPLAGHELLADWDPFPALAGDFAEIGEYVRQHDMRTSFHPDHYTVLSTPRREVLQTSVADLHRHVRMLEAMGLDESAKCNIHIGGAYGNKTAALERFCANVAKLDASIRNRLTLENDDKTFTAAETLDACERLGLPMVLDIHHHQVNPGAEAEPQTEVELWPRIRSTWKDPELLPPKIHASSPKSEKDPRAHADYVDVERLLVFLREVGAETPRLDVMIEAKMKDGALFKLMEELEGKSGVERIDQASIRLF